MPWLGMPQCSSGNWPSFVKSASGSRLNNSRGGQASRTFDRARLGSWLIAPSWWAHESVCQHDRMAGNVVYMPANELHQFTNTDPAPSESVCLVPADALSPSCDARSGGVLPDTQGTALALEPGFQRDAASTGGTVGAEAIPESSAPARFVTVAPARDCVLASGAPGSTVADQLGGCPVQPQAGLGRPGQGVKQAPGGALAITTWHDVLYRHTAPARSTSSSFLIWTGPLISYARTLQ